MDEKWIVRKCPNCEVEMEPIMQNTHVCHSCCHTWHIHMIK